MNAASKMSNLELRPAAWILAPTGQVITNHVQAKAANLQHHTVGDKGVGGLGVTGLNNSLRNTTQVPRTIFEIQTENCGATMEF